MMTAKPVNAPCNLILSGKRVCLFILLILLTNFSLKGQQDCMNPQLISLGNTVSITMTDSVYWLYFTAETAATGFILDNFEDTAISNYLLIELFDDCNQQLPVESCGNRLIIPDSMLNPNESYLLKLTCLNSQFFNTEFDITYAFYLNHNINFQLTPPTICEEDDLVITYTGDYHTVGKYFFYYKTNSSWQFKGDILASSLQTNQTHNFGPFYNNQGSSVEQSYVIAMTYRHNPSDPTPCLPHHQCCNTALRNLTVHAKPVITITPSIANPVCIGSDVQLTASVDAPLFLTSFSWCNNQTTNPATYPQITSSTLVNVEGTANNGCKTNRHYQINVVSPEVDFTFNEVCHGEHVSFTNLTSCNPPSVVSWLWSFGDGTTAQIANPNHKFPSTQNSYNVTLTATDINQVKHSVTKTVTLLPSPPLPVISVTNDICSTNIIIYTVPQIYDTYTWSITPGAGTILSGSGTHQITVDWQTLPTPPQYELLEITVSNSFGCEATATKKIFACCDAPPLRPRYCNLTLSSPVVHNGEIVYFDGHVMVESSLDLIGCEVMMGPDAMIEARNGGSVLINGGGVMQYCDFMWYSIVASDAQSSITVTNVVYVKDGQIALQSINGGNLFINNSTLDNNFIAVKLSNHLQPAGAPSLSFTILNSTIENTNNLLAFEPYEDRLPYAGIVVEEVNQVTIGATVSNTDDRVKFSNLQYGIKIKDAYTTIIGCEFDNIEAGVNNQNNTAAKFFDQGAIYAMHSYLTYAEQPLKKLVVGSSASGDECIFSKGKVGIYAENCLSLIGESGNSNMNTFSLFSYYAIKLINPHRGSVVTNNSIVQSRMGIWAANILQNVTLNGNLVPNPDNLFTINENLMDYVRYGIWIQNMSCIRRFQQVKIKDNEIHLEDSLDDVYGIRVDACNGINISNNIITRGTSDPVSDDIHTKKGIWLARTKHAAVYDNKIYRLGSGIYGNGDMHSTQFFCNVFTNSWHPFFFGTLSVITNQGYPGDANKQGWVTSNFFHNPISYKLEGYLNIPLGNPREWYYDGNFGVGADPGPLSGVIQPYISIIPLYTNFTHSCDPFSYKISEIAIEDAYQRDQLLGDILNEFNEYIELPDEFTWYEKAYLYEVLSSDTTLMYLDSDTGYANFYYMMMNDNIGRFANIRELIASGEITRAEELNAEMNDTTVIGNNTRKINNIYFMSVAVDRDEFTEEELDDLMEIALQTPYFGGDAVFEARVLLGLDILDYPSVPYRHQQPQLQQPQSFIVYPNPSTDWLWFESKIELESRGVLTLYTSSGKRVASHLIDNELSRFSVNISSLTPGIYFYSYVSPTFTSNGRFIKK